MRMRVSRCVQCSQSRPWPVLVICSVQCFSALGIAYGMGALYTDLRETFQASHSMAALVQSMCAGLMFTAGVVTGPVIQRCGPRVSMVLGSLLSTAGCLLAFFATDIVVVVVGMGAMQGVGVSFSYLSSLVTIRFLFNDIRSAALTCVTVVSAAGSATYPLLLRYLVHTYALRGTFLILSAIHVQLILLGVLSGTFSPSKWLWAEGGNFETHVETSPQVTSRLQGDHDLRQHQGSSTQGTARLQGDHDLRQHQGSSTQGTARLQGDHDQRHHQESSPQVTAQLQGDHDLRHHQESSPQATARLHGDHDLRQHRDEQLSEETTANDGPIPDERTLVTYPMVSVTCGNTERHASPPLQDSHAEHDGQPSKSVDINCHGGATHSDEDIPRGDVKPMQMSQQCDKTSNDETTESIDKDDSATDCLLHTADSEGEVEGRSHSAPKISSLEREGSGKGKLASAIEEDTTIYPSKPQWEREIASLRVEEESKPTSSSHPKQTLVSLNEDSNQMFPTQQRRKSPAQLKDKETNPQPSPSSQHTSQLAALLNNGEGGHLSEIGTPSSREDEDERIEQSFPSPWKRTMGPLLSCLRLQLEVLRNVRFVMIAASLTIFSSVMTASIFMTDLVRDDGLSVEDGSFFLTLVFVGNLVGRLIAGVLGIVLKNRIYIAFAVIITGQGVACLCFTLTSTYLSYVPVCLFFGLCFGLIGTGISLVNMSILPRRHYAAGLGITSFVAGLSMCLNGTLGGLVRDHSGEFGPMFYLSFGHALFHGSLLFITYFRTQAGARGKK